MNHDLVIHSSQHSRQQEREDTIASVYSISVHTQRGTTLIVQKPNVQYNENFP